MVVEMVVVVEEETVVEMVLIEAEVVVVELAMYVRRGDTYERDRGSFKKAIMVMEEMVQLLKIDMEREEIQEEERRQRDKREERLQSDNRDERQIGTTEAAEAAEAAG